MTNDINGFWEILKIVLPAIIVFITAYFLFRDMLENERRSREFEFRVLHAKEMNPVRLQAYERLTLFLERISPDSILVRETPHNLTAGEYHQGLLAAIRAEYEHNISQQIYVSPILWETIKGAKENLVMLINRSASELERELPAYELSKKIFANYYDEDPAPIALALTELKKEFSKFLG
ncbi:MAG: hypothetical protein LWW85_15100 [Marinilabiliales bacterium]|nr:hypothetical protein [Marinilabiliales bacterium]